MDFEKKVQIIARFVHAANNVLRKKVTYEEPVEYTEENQKSSEEGVRNILTGKIQSPQDSHGGWLKFKEDHGWKYGEVQDAEKKTHPCMVPYDELPQEQKIKDAMFWALCHVNLDNLED